MSAPHVRPHAAPARPSAGTAGRRAVLAAAVVLQLVVLYSPDDGGDPIMPGLDLLVHVFVFGAVVVAGLRAGVPALPLVVVLLVHAGVSELVQAELLAARTGDPRDVAADVAGTLLALAGGVLAGRRRRGTMGT
jgi:hypothetical protein